MLLFLVLLAGRHSDSTYGFGFVYFISFVVCVPLDVATDFSGYFIFS